MFSKDWGQSEIVQLGKEALDSTRGGFCDDYNLGQRRGNTRMYIGMDRWIF